MGENEPVGFLLTLIPVAILVPCFYVLDLLVFKRGDSKRLQSSITSAGKSLFLCFSTLDVRSAKSLQTKALKSFTRVNIENRMITQPLLWHTFNLLLMVNKLGNQTWDTLRNCQGYITIVSCMFMSYLFF